MQEPFKPSRWANLLDGPYPIRAFDMKSAAESLSSPDVSRFVNLWMTEGIPYAFRTEPMSYELIREWIGNRLNLQSKNVSMIGSARIGFSLSPDKFGQNFELAKSDLDIFVVSQAVFDSLHSDFDQWLEDWENGYIDEEKWGSKFWDENVKVVTNTVRRGFIDSNKVPPTPQCKMALKCQILVRDLRKYLTQHDGIPSKSSIRVYKNWDAALKQNRLNLESTLRDVGLMA